jgi:hypothetical protein
MKMNAIRILTVTAVFAMAVSASAQRPGGPGGFQAPPAMQAKFQAWQQWRGAHKNVSALQRTLGALSRLEQDPKTKLTKPQARAVLAVIRKWEPKPALTDHQAMQVNAQLTAKLSAAQKAAIAASGRGRGGPGGGRPGGFGGRPGGPGGGRPGGPGGGRPGGFGGRPGGPGGFSPASFPSPHDYNPLNPATSPFARSRQRGQQRLASLKAALVAAAK